MTRIKIGRLIGLIISLIFTSLVFIVPINREILLIFNLCIMTMTLIKTRLSIVSLWSIVTNYVMINVYAYDVTGSAYGVLGLTNISFVPMLRYMLILNMSLFIWSYSTKILQYEELMLSYSEFKPGRNFTTVCSVIAVLAILIAFPTIPFAFNSEKRFESLLPGNAWNHLAIVTLLFILPNIKRYKKVVCAYIIVCFWFLSHYERVDVLGLLVVMSFIYIVKNKGKKNVWIKYIKVAVIGMMIFVILSFLGEARMNSSFSVTNIAKKIITQNTASDVGYVYDVAIRYMNDYDLLHGVTYLRYLFKYVPGINLDYLEPAIILGQHYWLPGGSFFLNEPLMNFGIIGVIVVPNIWIFFVYYLLKKETNMRYIIYLFLLATPFRYLWYGMDFIETGLVIFIPGMYLLYKLIRKKVS